MTDRHHRRSVLAILAVPLLVLQSIGAPIANATTQLGGQGRDRQVFGRAPDTTPSAVARRAIPIDLGSGGGASSPSGSSVNGGATLRSTEPRYRPPTTATELVTERSRNRRVTANPDGTFTLEASTCKLNYVAPDGSWQPLDLSLVGDKSGAYSLRTAANDVQLRIATESGDTAVASATAGAHTVTLRAVGYGAGRASLGSEVDYARALTDPAVLLRPADDGFEFGARFDDPRQTPVLDFVLDTGDLTASLGADGQTILLTDKAGSVVGSISAPIMLDVNEVPAPPTSVQVRLLGPKVPVEPAPTPTSTPVPSSVPSPSPSTSAPSESPTPSAAASDGPAASPGLDATPSLSPTPQPPSQASLPVPPAAAELKPSEILLTYAVDPAWLAAPDRAFPVTLDPDVCIGNGSSGATGCTNPLTTGSSDFFVASGISSYPVGWTTTRVGYDVRTDDGDTYATMRGLVYLADYTTMPDGAVITDTDLQLHISSEYGSPNGETLNAYRIDTGWTGTTTWTQWAGGAGYTGSAASATVPTSGYMHWDVDAIVRQWYNRTPKNWAGNLGFAVRMATEGSTHGEVEFDRYNDQNLDFRPLLRITYIQPHVRFDFDPILGSNYAPSTMLAGQTVKLPITVLNNASGYTFNHCTGSADCYRVGYRWIDGKGNFVTPLPTPQDFTADIPSATGASNPTSVFALNVTAPATVGQYRLRLDLVLMSGGSSGTAVYASDSAQPSKYYSRVKNALTASNTRWTGSSNIEREEYGITVASGAGGVGGPIESVTTGTGDSLGINLGSGNLDYRGDTGLGFSDLVSLPVTYGYDSANAYDPANPTVCPWLSISLTACGWFTNWDERITPGSSDGQYNYFDPQGNRYFVTTDGSEQLSSGAPVQIERPRTTFFDDNVITTWGGSATPTVVTTPVNSGLIAYQTSANLAIFPYTYGGAPDVSLNNFRYASFALRTSSTAGAAMMYLLKNGTTGITHTLAYTVGSPFTVAGADATISVTTATPQATWRFIAQRDLLSDVQAQSGWGSWPDPWTVTGFKVVGNGGSGYVYFDSIFFEGRASMGYTDGTPAWSGGATAVSDETADVFAGAKSLRVAPTTYASSPTCANCNSARMTEFPFVSWAWKKIGGQTASVSFEVDRYRKDKTSGAYTVINAAGWITYYAGPTPPAGAVNAIQVADQVPDDWTVVRRNLAADAAQVLNWYNDAPSGSSSIVPQAPIPDPLYFRGWKLATADGNGLLVDQLGIFTLPDIANGAFAANEYGTATATVNGSVVPPYDFVITYPDHSRRYFARDGQLLRITNPDSYTAFVDWSRTSFTQLGLSEYRLDKLRAATDGATSGGNTYVRQIDVTVVIGTTPTPTTVTFTEQLGTTAAPVTGRQARFTVATGSDTAHAIADLSSVSPARDDGSCASAPNGCVGFDYSDSTTHHLYRVTDPRYTGANDYRWEAGWTANQATSISQRMGGSAHPVLTVLSFDTNPSGLYRRPLFISGSDRHTAATTTGSVVDNAEFVELTSDGSELATYEPLACAAGGCTSSSSTWPEFNPDRPLTTHQFDGLARVETTTSYRVNGASPQISVTRRATRAGAKVDNFSDPLTAGKLAWTQSADQYFASMHDSAGTNPDLYRTDVGYDFLGGVATSTTAVPNERLDFTRTVGDLSSLLRVDYRLDENSHAPGILHDSAGTPDQGMYFGGQPNAGFPGALLGDSNPAGQFDGALSASADMVDTLSAPYTVSIWAKPSSTTVPLTMIGTRGGGDWSFDMKFQPGMGLHADIGTGSAWLTTTADAPLAYNAGQWYHVVYVVGPTGYTIYVNGQALASGSYATAGTPRLWDVNHSFFIAQNGLGTELFQGTLDEAMVFTEALDPSRVAAIYDAGRDSAAITTRTTFDRTGKPLQTTNQFLGNPGFEGGLTAWRSSGSGVSANLVTATGASTVRSGEGSLKITNTTDTAWQGVTLVPGQTFRFQAAGYGVSGGTPKIDLQYWTSAGGGTWVSAFASGQTFGASWSTKAWDVTIPLDLTDGRVRVVASNTTTGTAYLDDVAVVTTWSTTTYTDNTKPFQGLPETVATLPLTSSASVATINARTEYAASSAHPAMYPTKIVANYADGVHQGSDPADADLVAATTFDAWGRPLVQTDPDGIATTTTYDTTNKTDAVTTTLGSDTTTYAYDAVGNRVTTESPLHRVAATTYDLFNHPLDVTGPDGVVTTHAYGANGTETATYANHVDSVPNNDGSGTDDIETLRSVDPFGHLTDSVVDSGAISAETTTTYDLLGNTLTSTTFGDSAHTDARTTTSFVETYQVPGGPLLARSTPSGQQAPIDPGSVAPLCPGSATVHCSTVSQLDAAGRAIASIDAYNHATHSDLDLDGRPVRVIANYDDGVYSGSAPDRDRITTTVYTPSGLARVTKDPAGLVTVTDYDAVGRAITVTAYDTGYDPAQPTQHRISIARTTFTPGGRTRLTSAPDDPAKADATRIWSRTVYDKAGRVVATLGNVDFSGAASIVIDDFEDRVTAAPGKMLEPADDRIWGTGAIGSQLVSGASTTADNDAQTIPARTGRGRLHVSTNGAANQGVALALPGTYKASATYQARVYARWDGTGTAPLVQAELVNAAGAVLGTASSPTTLTTAYIALDVPAWSVGGSDVSGISLLVRQTNGVTSNWFLDDATVWDATAWAATSSGNRAFGIPMARTIYDGDGRTIESIAPPGVPGEAGMVTASAFDRSGQGVIVSTDATLTYSAVIRAANPAAYFRFDEPSGTTASTNVAGTALTIAGGARLAVAGAIDEARTGIGLDGTSGYAARPSAALSATNDYALEAWIRLDRAPTSAATIVRNGTSSAGYGIGIGTDRTLQVIVNATMTSVGAALNPGTWHYVALTRQAGTSTLYLDGTALTPTVATAPSTPGASFAVGRTDATTSSGYFPGVIDEVAAYATGAFGASVVTAHWKAGRHVADPAAGDFDPATNLTSRTVFDPLGRPVDGWDALYRRTHAGYDRLGRQTSTVQNYVDGLAEDALTAGSGLDNDVTSTFAYDAAGELVAYCPAANILADACNVLDNGVSHIQYRSAWHWAYDKLGRQVRQVPPVVDPTNGVGDLAVREWVYDAGGRLATVRDVWDGIGSQPAGLCTSQNNAFRYVSTPAGTAYDWLGQVLDEQAYRCPTPTSQDLHTVRTYGTFGPQAIAATPGGGSTDTLAWTYDAATGQPDQLKRGSAVLTDWSWNADGTLRSRVDGTDGGTAISGYDFSYDWAKRPIAQATSSGQTDLLGGSATWSYRLDGLLGGRAWPGVSSTASVTYDAAKRPTTLAVGSIASFSQTYDRRGNTLSEGRSIAGVPGTNGGQTQTFAYDGLDRVLTGTLNGTTTNYEYSLNGDRRKVGASASTYNRADQLVTGPNGTFGYDSLGNMTTSHETATAVTYGYDAADHLTSIGVGSTSTTMSLDALGRMRTRTVQGSPATTYSYLGATKTVARLDDGGTGSADVSSVLTADGSRLLALQTSPTAATGWLVPDLHGNVAAAIASGNPGTITNALRYDAFGAVVGTPYSASGAGMMPWAYQGRLDVASGSGASTLYDMSARNYAPGLGTFTSMDSVVGQAADPRSMNRYTYAEANPWTLVDPTGHTVCRASNYPDCDMVIPSIWSPPPPTPPRCTDKDCRDEKGNSGDDDGGGADKPRVPVYHTVGGTYIVGPNGTLALRAQFDAAQLACQPTSMLPPSSRSELCNSWWATLDAWTAKGDAIFFDPTALVVIDSTLSGLDPNTVELSPEDVVHLTDNGSSLVIETGAASAEQSIKANSGKTVIVVVTVVTSREAWMAFSAGPPSALGAAESLKGKLKVVGGGLTVLFATIDEVGAAQGTDRAWYVVGARTAGRAILVTLFAAGGGAAGAAACFEGGPLAAACIGATAAVGSAVGNELFDRLFGK